MTKFDNAFYEKLKSGCESSYKQFYQAKKKGTLTKVYTITKDMEEAEEIMQDAFVSFWQRIQNGELRDIAYPASYFAVIVRNMRIKFIRKKRQLRQLVLEEYTEDLVFPVPFDNLFLLQELKQVISAGIHLQMPARRQHVFRLRFFEGKTLLEIAEELEMTYDEVKNQSSLANKFVRKLLKKHYI